MKKRLTMLSAFPMLLVASACASNSTALKAVSDYCAIAAPIMYDTAKDSPETVEEIERHNSKFVCVCRDDCPADPLVRKLPPVRGDEKVP